MFEQYINEHTGQHYPIKIYHRKKNGNDYEENPFCSTQCEIVGSAEKKELKLLKGVIGKEDSITIKVDNLPQDVEIDDKVFFRGGFKLVKAVGYYYDETNFVDESVLSDEYITAICPKGLILG